MPYRLGSKIKFDMSDKEDRNERRKILDKSLMDVNMIENYIIYDLLDIADDRDLLLDKHQRLTKICYSILFAFVVVFLVSFYNFKHCGGSFLAL